MNQAMAFKTTLAALALLVPTVAQADGEQLYFIGYSAPAGSISDNPGAASAAYLRWDVVEGALPADVAAFRLERNGAPVGAPMQARHTPAEQAALAARIDAIYAGPQHARRRAETLAALEGIAGAPVADAGFATALAEAIIAADDGDPTARQWVHQASRLDFNVARARGRGYLDHPPGSSTYVLWAVSALDGVADAKLGTVDVDAVTPTIVDGGADFDQVSSFHRCDAPEYAREHGTVALTWDHPGANGTERYFAAINIVGYDLYRTTGPAALPGPVELRDLAAAVGHDARGQIELPGLHKVNELPIAISGRPDADPVTHRRTMDRHTGWNPDFAQHMETHAELKAQGAMPGDSFWYYLVPRDMSGNYGRTQATEVVVPDLLAPPAPWAIESIARSERGHFDDALADADAVVLQWDHVNVPNYFRDYRFSRTFCNLEEARVSGRLLYAPRERACDEGRLVQVNAAVDRYVVYGFDSEAEARAFTDTDGDGISDVEEQQPTGLFKGGFQLTDPGTACDPSAGAGTDRRAAVVPAADAVRTEDGRLVLQAAFSIGAAAKGDVRWYRVSAVGTNDRVSVLSQPVRAFFPKETKPKRPGKVGFGWCDYYARQVPPNVNGWNAVDHTGDAASVRFTCIPRRQDNGLARANQEGVASFLRFGGAAAFAERNDFAAAEPPPEEQERAAAANEEAGGQNFRLDVANEAANQAQLDPNAVDGEQANLQNAVVNREGAERAIIQRRRVGIPFLEIPLETIDDGLLNVGNVGERECPLLHQAARVCEIEAQFMDAEGRVLASTPVDLGQGAVAGIADNIGRCDFTVELRKDCREGVRPVRPGGIIDGTLVVDPGPIANCVSVNREIDGESRRVAFLCPGDWPWHYDVPGLGADLQCFTLTVHDENNNTSTDVELPCFKVQPSGPPDPPKMISLEFVGNDGRMRWAAPDMPTAGVMMEWSLKGGDIVRSDFFGHAGAFGIDNPHEVMLPLTPAPAPGDEEIWCVRARAIATHSASDADLMSEWSAPLCQIRTTEYPDYLPWPDVKAPGTIGDELAVRYMPNDGIPAIQLGELPTSLLENQGHDLRCVPLDRLPICRRQEACVNDDAVGFRFCDDFCERVDAALGTNRRFVVYRQSKTAAAAAPGDFQQVSPLIERAYCGRICAPEIQGEDFDLDLRAPGLVPRPGEQAGGIVGVENVNNGLNADVNVNVPGGGLGENECIEFLHDPYVKLMVFPDQTDPWPTLSLAYVDRYPHVSTYHYRYQVVFFDARGEITGHRNTDWIQAP